MGEEYLLVLGLIITVPKHLENEIGHDCLLDVGITVQTDINRLNLEGGGCDDHASEGKGRREDGGKKERP